MTFSGFNSTLRQGFITHHEYIQVGKGRDVGMNQISLFEAKVANGNGEQSLSRDVYRLGRRFDFYRMLSFYFTTVGFYFSSMVINQISFWGSYLASLRYMDRNLSTIFHEMSDFFRLNLRTVPRHVYYIKQGV